MRIETSDDIFVCQFIGLFIDTVFFWIERDRPFIFILFNNDHLGKNKQSTKFLVKINMNQSNVSFLDLPNEILLMILKKLDNMDVLYSLLDVHNQRLDMIVQEKTFTKSLSFVLTTSTDDILSIPDAIIDRFCIKILPKIDYNVTCLVLESESMERILLAAKYPNLVELKLFNFLDKVASRYFTGKQLA